MSGSFFGTNAKLFSRLNPFCFKKQNYWTDNDTHSTAREQSVHKNAFTYTQANEVNFIFQPEIEINIGT
jgi:hypothetical protein